MPAPSRPRRSRRTASSARWSDAICRRERSTPRGRRRRAPALEVRGLTRAPCFRDVSLSVGRGEIVGLFGLVGSGRSELLETIFGLHRPQRGTIAVGGRPLRLTLAAPGRARRDRARPRGTPSPGALLQPHAAAEPDDAGPNGCRRRADSSRGMNATRPSSCCAEWRIKAAGAGRARPTASAAATSRRWSSRSGWRPRRAC